MIHFNKFAKQSIAYFFSVCMCIGSVTGLCGCGNAKDYTLPQSVDVPADSLYNPEVISYGGIEGALDDNYRNYYEIFVYSFFDTDGDGIGDLNGVTEKLDYVADLGCNGIWLMPIMPSPTYHKYDCKDYFAVDPEYGTIDDFKALTDGAHELGIRVIIDFVINHSSSQNQWFIDACDYLKTLSDDEEPDESVCPYVGYYHFTKKKPGGTWYAVKGTEYCYEGQFWDQMPDLNLSNENLKRELEASADFWMDLGVDGFRMDAPLHFEKGDTNFNCQTLSWLYEYCKAKNPNFYMVSEVWSSSATIANYYASKTPSFFNFATSDFEGIIMKTAMGSAKAEKFVNTMVKYREDYGSVYSDYIDAPFITNHDQGRPCNMVQGDEDALKFSGGLLFTMSGNPFVYYGEEVGMKSKGNKDENKRLAMNWSLSDIPGKCKGPKDAEKVDQSFEGVDIQEKREDSLLSYYKRGLRMRNLFPEIARGMEEVCEETSENCALLAKTYEGKTLYIAYNTDKENAANFDISDRANKEGLSVAYSLTLQGEEIKMIDGVLNMPARSICILERNN